MKKLNTKLARAAAALMLAVLIPAGAWADSSVVTVGSTTYGHSYLPSSPDEKFSTSQQIYTSDEIGKAGLITSIAFYNYDTGSERSYDIYLSHTSKAAFDSETDWVTVAESNKVFSGTVKLMQGVWTVIDFDTPFQYNGTQNLILTVDDNTGKSTGYNYNIGSYSASGHQALFYYQSANLDPTQPITEAGVFHPSYSSYERKNGIQLCFETYPKPYKFEAVEIGDVSAQIQCSLRGDATAWNLRYRKVGEDTWKTESNLTDRSKKIGELTPLTQYEVQVQAIFTGGNTSDWTSSLLFTTNCCPVEEQSALNYALRSNYTSWYGFAVQIMDITDANNPVEAAYLHAPSFELYTGSISLCSGHKYQVNWIYDADHANVNNAFMFSLSYSNGDELYSMDYYEAPQETAQLTTFVMDDGNFDYLMPTQLTADETYQDATLAWKQTDDAKQWLVTYSKDPNFDPDEPEEDCIVLAESNPYTLPELTENTNYYFAVRAVELEDVAEAPAHSTSAHISSQTVKIMKGGKIKVKIGDKWVTKKIKRLSRSKIKRILKSCDQKSRPKVVEYIRRWKGGDNKLLVDILLPKPRGSEIRYGVLTKMVGDEGTDVPLAELKSRVLKGNSEAINKHQVSITSETTPGGFDNVIFIKAKKGSEVVFVMSQGKTGAHLEPFSVGWVSFSQLGITNFEDIEDAEKVPNEKLQKALDEGKRYEMKHPNETKMTKMVAEANDDTEADGKAPQKATEETGQDGVLYIRHNETVGGYLRVQEVKVIAPNEVKEWTAVDLPEGQMKYTQEDVPTGSTMVVKSEPVYKDGSKGLNSPISVINAPGEDTAPLPGKFSVAANKQVYFSKGNLNGWRYEDDWSLAATQYTMKGNANMTESGYPADEVDLFAWSTPQDYYGTAFGYGDDDESVVARFQGPFVEWGKSEGVTLLMGSGWQTLANAEWRYLLDERSTAAELKALATVAGTKGLVLLPDAWKAPADITVADGGTYTAEQWTSLETAGAVFLPAAGKLNDGMSVDEVSTTGYYWSSTPSNAKASATMKDDAYMMTFDGNGTTTTDIMSRRTGGAVRLVMCNEMSVTTAESGYTTLVSNVTLDFASTEGLAAYYASDVDNDANTVALTPISLIPANTPIVLKGDPSTTYRIKATVTSTNPPTGNLLRGSATENTELEAGAAYILSGGKFCRNAAGTMPAGKAYLPAVTLSSGARQLTIVIDGDATAIHSLDVDERPSRTGIYNLQGQRVKTPGKGLYIINGKKVIIK